MKDEFLVKFWGCRGSTSHSANDKIKYGTNTPCISLECGDAVLVFDSGTGIINFDRYYYDNCLKKEINIFYSHYHLDHATGIAFTRFISDADVKINMYGRSVAGNDCKTTIRNLFVEPYFPVDIFAVNTSIFSNKIVEGEKTFINKDVLVENINVNHPGGSSSYKITYKGKSFCLLSDYEYDGDLNHKVSDFVKGSDILVFDSYYSKDSYREGWGHSTWEQGVELFQKNQIKKLYLFHHNILSSDDDLDNLEIEAAGISEDIIISRDNMYIDLFEDER